MLLTSSVVLSYPLFGTYSSTSCCLILCFYLYALDWLVRFSNLGEVALCMRCPRRCSSSLSLVIWAIHSLCRLYVPYCYGSVECSGHAGRQGLALVLLFASPYLSLGLMAYPRMAGYAGWETWAWYSSTGCP